MRTFWHLLILKKDVIRPVKIFLLRVERQNILRASTKSDAMSFCMQRTALSCRADRPLYVTAVGRIRTARTALGRSKHHFAQRLWHRRSSDITCVAQSQRRSTSSAESRGKREVKVKVVEDTFSSLVAHGSAEDLKQIPSCCRRMTQRPFLSPCFGLSFSG